MARASLYRKYRSQSFSDLVGQSHVVRTLQNGITTGRIAHAFLFTGPRGTGKTSTARLMAKALCCEKGPASEPCNECAVCVAITENTCLDVHEMDAASESGVDDVRESIVEAVSYKPSMARYRVFIIDEVHDLSAKAFDALLKTIEEPPEHVIFMLATTEYTKVPTTIRSRCQKFEFHRASMADLINRISYVAEKEGVTLEPAAATAIARMADGGFRDALTLLEQAIIASENGNITTEQVYDQLGLIADSAADGLLMALKSSDIPKIIELSGELARLGRDPRAIVESLLFRTAELTRAAYNVDMGGVDAAQAAVLHETAQRVGLDNLLWLRSALAETHLELKNVTLPRLWFEAQLIRLAQARVAPVRPAVEERPRTEPRAAVATQPARPTPTPQPEPKAAQVQVQPVTKAVAETPKPEPAPEPAKRASTGNPEMDKAIEVYERAMSLLEPGVALQRKLHGAQVAKVSGSLITVEVPRRMDAVWVNDDPRRGAYLVSKLATVNITGWTFEFVPPAQKRMDDDPEPVELELSGKALYDAVKEVSQA